MKTKRIYALSLADPETRFKFERINGDVKVSFLDWQLFENIVIFKGAELFKYSYHPPYKEIPEECFLEIVDSELIEKLIDDRHILAHEGYKHYLLSTNEDEWCEVIATGIELPKQKGA